MPITIEHSKIDPQAFEQYKGASRKFEDQEGREQSCNLDNDVSTPTVSCYLLNIRKVKKLSK